MDKLTLQFILTVAPPLSFVVDAKFRVVASSQAAMRRGIRVGDEIGDRFELPASVRATLRRSGQSTVKRKLVLKMSDRQIFDAKAARLGGPFLQDNLTIIELHAFTESRAAFAAKTREKRADRRNRGLSLLNSDLNQINNRLRERAMTDGMTGLRNKSAFYEQLKRLHRSARPFALIYIDMNNLKRINDDLGHLAGDAAICAVSEGIRASIRGTDFAGRMGGDEFAITVTGLASRDDLENFASRLLQSFEQHRHNGDKAPQHRLSAAMGAAIWPTDGNRLEDIMDLADKAMYVSKRAGEDIVFASQLNRVTPMRKISQG